MQPFRFFGGAGEVVDGRGLAEQARRAEGAGYDALVVRVAAGDRFEDLILNTYPSMSPVMVTDHALREADALAARASAGSGGTITGADLLDSPHIFIGTIDALVDKIVGLRERFGISCVMLDDVDALEPIVERLAGR